VTVEVRAVTSRSDRRHFRDLPQRLHGNDPAFVPMLDAALAAVLDRNKNPFWRRATGCEWLAWRDGRPVGRVGACADGALRAQVEGCGAVGFLDCEDDPSAAAALLGTAEAWLRENGCVRARGPLNYSIHDTAGVLVDGFGTPPTIDTTWNPPYFAALWEGGGWRGAQDMLACAGPGDAAPERTRRFAERARRKGAVTRPLDMGNFDAEVERIRKVYNAAWQDNWGHVPISSEEFAFKAKDLKAVLDPALLRIAEVEGEVVGFILGLPDLNVAIRRCRGRLLPFGWFHLLRAKHTCSRARVIALGVTEGHRRRGLEAFLLAEAFRATGGQYKWAEASWVLAGNAEMLNGLRLYQLTEYKRWRMYEKELSAPGDQLLAG